MRHAIEQGFLHPEKNDDAQMVKGAEVTYPGQLTSCPVRGYKKGETKPDTNSIASQECNSGSDYVRPFLSVALQT